MPHINTMMKNNILRNYLFIVIAMLLFHEVNAQVSSSVQHVSPKEVNQFLKTKGGLLLDVRTTQEWNEDGYIKGAVLIDAYAKDLRQQVGNKVTDKKKPIYVYCAAGGRSARVAQRLIQEGYTQVYNMKGGIYQWIEEGLPLQTSAK